MAMDQVEFEFPDEKEEKASAAGLKAEQAESESEIEVIDDTPEKDRGREPSEPPSEVTEEELESYSDKVKKRISHLSKGYHDERRVKEAALREREEALRFAQQILEENKRLKGAVSESSKVARESEKTAAEAELAQAKARFKKAYEDGDVDLLSQAQEDITDARIKLNRFASFKEEIPLQEEKEEYNPPKPTRGPDPRAVSWQQQNAWFGQDKEMTAFALGVHEKLVDSGIDPTSDEYYDRLNRRLRQVYPESFEEVEVEKPVKKAKPANVVAPASRSTAPKKIVLTQTQVALAKRLGVPLELYAKQVAEQMGKVNG
jgi:hypothetical protein